MESRCRAIVLMLVTIVCQIKWEAAKRRLGVLAAAVVEAARYLPARVPDERHSVWPQQVKFEKTPGMVQMHCTPMVQLPSSPMLANAFVWQPF
jgi:hypothetical protein